MKRSLILTLVVVILAGALTLAAEGRKYGKSLTLKEKTKISDILANPQKFNGKRVLVEGPVVGVCPRRGCWIKIAGEKDFESLIFKVKDGVITFPMDAKGKTALAEGVLSARTYTREELIEMGKEHAKEEGKEFDPSTVKGPKTVVRIEGEGAVLK
ncbi:MAG: DUF4920 domain-containing protein [Armatimonadetes bacterium]|nr:DUF4920 domain-containing protein [Armatimonadota bacterium]